MFNLTVSNLRIVIAKSALNGSLSCTKQLQSCHIVIYREHLGYLWM